MARMPRMIISTEGGEGSGKTDFALRTTPRPCVYLDFDYGTEGVGGLDNEEMMQDVELIQYDPFGPAYLDEEKEKQAARAKPEVDRFIKDFREAITAKVPTLVVDTFTVAWAAQRVGNPDKRYVEIESEFHGLVRSAFISPHTNLILIHHLKKDWLRTGDGKSFPSGTWSIDGMDGIKTKVQLAIRQAFKPPKIVQGQTLEEAKFTTEILKARDNNSMVGFVQEGYPSFEELCTMVCPSVDWGSR